MHMADGFISPTVGCTMWAASAAITTLCARTVSYTHLVTVDILGNDVTVTLDNGTAASPATVSISDIAWYLSLIHL